MGRNSAEHFRQPVDNLDEGHYTCVRTWASFFLRPSEHETAFLVFPRKGMAIEPGRAAAAAVVSSRPVNGDGSPQGRF